MDIRIYMHQIDYDENEKILETITRLKDRLKKVYCVTFEQGTYDYEINCFSLTLHNLFEVIPVLQRCVKKLEKLNEHIRAGINVSL